MAEQEFTYAYPRPMVTVDAVVVSGEAAHRQILLIQRGHAPFAGKWALPGGFVDMEETLERAVARELREETGVAGVPLRQFRTYGDPGRDPRGRSISVAYLAQVEAAQHAPQGGDDAADARWFSANDLPPLAFDHARIIIEALQYLDKEDSS